MGENEQKYLFHPWKLDWHMSKYKKGHNLNLHSSQRSPTVSPLMTYHLQSLSANQFYIW